MVLLTDLIEGFYSRVRRRRILLISAVDLDAICATKILQGLFKADHIEYTLVPVETKDEMRMAYEDYRDTIKNIVLVGCGGAMELLGFMQPEEDAVFYIFDSQRPLDLENIYNKDQVHLLAFHKESFDGVPMYDQIYASDSEGSDGEDELREKADSEGEEDGESEPGFKRRRIDREKRYEKRRAKLLWSKKRDEALDKYGLHNYHGAPSALVAYDLARKLAKENTDILWWTIIAITERYLHRRGSSDDYDTFVEFLEAERSRLEHETDSTAQSINSLKLTSEDELRLVLYRHWSLYDSLFHSPYTSAKFKLWTIQGQKTLHELLANMGLPLSQCKEKFSSMSLQYRDSLREQLEDNARKSGFDQLTYSSFLANFGYRHTVSAADMVYSCTALLEKPGSKPTECFMETLDALTRTNFEKIHSGLELAIQNQRAITCQVRSFIDTRQIVSTGPFIFAELEEGVPDVQNFEHPIILRRLLYHVMETWITLIKKAKAQGVPYVISVPLTRRPGYCMIVGVAPYNKEDNKCILARKFDVAAQKLEANAEFNFFDGTGNA
jgi:cell division control protein 45